MRRPQFPPVEDSSPSGRVRIDDRGNAFWELARNEQNEDVRTEDLLRHPGLSIAEDAAPADDDADTIKRVPAGSGYNPYQSGLVDRERARKRNLRELSKWIELRKRRGEDTEA